MCLAFWTLTHPRYALILVSNRDEFLSRPTVPASWHNFDRGDGDTNVLSGRDMMAGGTWLGINKQGDVALLTNITEPTAKFPTSRGELTTAYLTSPANPDRLSSYVSQLVSEKRPYAGFNLLLISPKQAGIEYQGVLVTNSGGGGPITSRPLSESECLACGLSNSNDACAPVETDQWPKVGQGKKLFQDVVAKELGEDELLEALCDVMSVENPTRPTTRFGLRTTISVPPIPVEPDAWSQTVNPDPALPASVDAAPALMPESKPQKDFYGTRLTSVILVSRDGRVTFVERDVWVRRDGEEPTKVPGERRFTFDIPQ